jgi:hypothetical protein
MSHKVTQIFVPTAADDAAARATTGALATQELTVFSPDLGSNLSATAADADFKIVMGTGSSKFGTFKSSTISPENIISTVKTTPSSTVTQQVTHLGYDGVSTATPSFSCDEEYVVTLKIDEYWSKGIYQPMIQESVRVKTACCDTCSGGCDALDAEVYMDALVTEINENPLLSKYVVAAKVGAGSDWGVSLTGKALDEFGNECVPDAVPYVFNLVRFKVSVHEGPYNTQDFDIEDQCDPWAITYTTDIVYPIGAGPAMAELERHYFANNLPATHEARRYWNPVYNNDSDAFLFVDKTATYNMYEITYLEDSPVGFEKKTRNTHSAVILIDSTNAAEIADLETALNNVLPTEYHF